MGMGNTPMVGDSGAADQGSLSNILEIVNSVSSTVQNVADAVGAVRGATSNGAPVDAVLRNNQANNQNNPVARNTAGTQLFGLNVDTTPLIIGAVVIAAVLLLK